LLSDLIDRGLDAQRMRLWVIDGGKALRKAIQLPGVNYPELRVASPVNVTGRVVVALWVFFESLMVEGRLWACGRRRRRWATQPPSGALSTVPAGAP
jgi:hypothetical protein